MVGGEGSGRWRISGWLSPSRAPQKPGLQKSAGPPKNGVQTPKPPKMAKNPITSRKSHFYGEKLGVRGQGWFFDPSPPPNRPPPVETLMAIKRPKTPNPKKRVPGTLRFSPNRGDLRVLPLTAGSRRGTPKMTWLHGKKGSIFSSVKFGFLRFRGTSKIPSKN